MKNSTRNAGALAQVAACALALFALLACGCGSSKAADAEGLRGTPVSASAPRGVPGAPTIILGTTLEADTGAPLAGVLVQAPGGIQATSDEQGRFELRGLAPGTRGELRASTEDGLSGVVLFRPLASGTLEVVIHLVRPTEE